MASDFCGISWIRFRPCPWTGKSWNFQSYAQKESVRFQIQPSWAGHDAMILGHELPTAMLFVPSKNGISHSPEEFTSAEDIGQAASVLEKVLTHLTRE